MRHIILILCAALAISACSVFRGSFKSDGDQQKKTVDVMRDIGTAVEAFKLNTGHYPVSTDGEVDDIKHLLVPEYIDSVTERDGWGTEIEYYCAKPEGPYYVISLGSDKDRDVGLYHSNRSPSGLGFTTITSLTEDIIFSNGVFVRYPEGLNVAKTN
jgi:type II secretory pathway pseudopilin PulG